MKTEAGKTDSALKEPPLSPEDGNANNQPPSNAPPISATQTESPAELLHRMELLLSEIRANLNALTRDRQHDDFSFVRLTGAIVQSIVVALVLWAFSDCVFGPRINATQVVLKLGFAGVLQVAALTAFLVSRDRP